MLVIFGVVVLMFASLILIYKYGDGKVQWGARGLLERGRLSLNLFRGDACFYDPGS